MPTASKVLVRKGESALDRLATAAAISSATVKAEGAPIMLNKLFNPNGNGGTRKTAHGDEVDQGASGDDCKSHSIVLPTQTRSGRTIKRKSPVDLSSTNFKRPKEGVKVEHEQDNVFGDVIIFREPTSLRHEIQQLRVFYEKHGRSPTPSENHRLNELCTRLRQVRRNPTKSHFHIGNRKPGEKLSEEIISMLDSFNFEWEPVAKPKQYPNTLQGRIEELKDVREKYGPLLNGTNRNGIPLLGKKRKKVISKFCSDLRQSRKNPDNPKYQLSESDISELTSFGFEWDKAPVLPKKTKAKVRILSSTIEKLAGPPADGERYTQMEVIELSLIHGKRFVIKAIEKSRFPQDSKQLYQYFPRANEANQLFADDIVRELLCKHVIGSDEWHTKVDVIVESKHGPSEAHIYKLFNYTKE